MPASVTVRDQFGWRVLAGIAASDLPNTRQPDPNTRQTITGGAPVPRVIHMLIINQWTATPRYLAVTIAGGYWHPSGGYWAASETRNTRHFDLVKSQFSPTRRVLAGVGGCSFEVFTYGNPVEAPHNTKTHVFADPRFSLPANTRRTPVPIPCSHGVNTRPGAR